MTLVCVPITVESVEQALEEAALARTLGADLIELRVDDLFTGEQHEADEIIRLLSRCPLPAILTCRPAWEGGGYDGDETDRISMFEFVCTSERPPAYLDVELAAYTASENIRQKVNLCVAHPKQTRSVKTRLILSSHDFDTRPADLTKRLLAMYAEPSCAVAKIAYRARSIRDNLELFEITREAPKPTIALGMGEFGLMSRVLAPKFGGFLTFASLRDESATAPGQPTISDLLGMYRFRSIGRQTKLYGVIGWPVTQSLSPAIHNAGFEAVGHDGVYLPLPVVADPEDAEASTASVRVTIESLADHVDFAGASVTIPHKEALACLYAGEGDVYAGRDVVRSIGAANTLSWEWHEDDDVGRIRDSNELVFNTDAVAVRALLDELHVGVRGKTICVVGAGGAARAAVWAGLQAGAEVVIANRTTARAEAVADWFNGQADRTWERSVRVIGLDEIAALNAAAYVNCTPVGMATGPDPDGLSIPVPDMLVAPATVFFDTVYNPIETPMLRAVRERGCRTIDGVQMFVRQAAEQFRLWTGKAAPVELFDRICRDKLGG
ncbi:MAG: type I 3-dehydroquinate dehydratase [Planctomycetota bacterium]